MVGILRREEQVDVDRRSLCGFDAQAQLDIREDQTHTRHTAAALLPHNLFVTLDTKIVGDA